MNRAWLVVCVALSGCVSTEPVRMDAQPTRELDGLDGCSDGVDSDGDGLVDCLDPDCDAECRPDNRPPFAPTVTISPAAPTTWDDLVCAADAEDPDDDPVEHSFSWWFDGVQMATGATLLAENTIGYDHWICRATPSDGALSGTPAEAGIDVLADDGCMALSFTLGDAVAVPRFSGQDLVGTDFTVEAWVRLDSSYAGLTQPLVSSDIQDDGSGWRLAASGPSGLRALRFQLGSGSNRVELYSFGLVPEDRWVHVAVGFDGTAGLLHTWVDGFRVGGGAFTGPVPGSSVADLVIGADAPYSVESLNGELDEVRISSVNRYGSNDFAPRIWFEPDADTIGLWHFDEGSGAVASDAAYGHPGALSGASWTGQSACQTLPSEG